MNSAFIRITQSPCCKTHMSCFKTMNDFERHLRQNHTDLEKTEIEDLVNKCKLEARNMKPLDTSEKALCDSYWKYYSTEVEKQDGVFPDEILPRVPFIKVETLKQCDKCFQIVQNRQKHAAHKKRCDSVLRDVSAQSLMDGRKSRYFRVEDSTVFNAQWLLDEIMETEKVDVRNEAVMEGNRGMDALVNQLRCAEHLKNFGLSETEAWETSRWIELDDNGRKVEQSIFKLVQSYVEDAISMNNHNVFIKTHTFLGQKMHISLQPDTIIDYIKKVCSLMYFCYNLATNSKFENCMLHKPMSLEQIGLMEWLIEKSFEEDVGNYTKRQFHSFVSQAFFSCQKDDIQLIPLFIACNCVVKDEDHDDGATFHYARGRDTSHLFAALLHFAQCIVVHGVYGSFSSCSNEGIFSLTRGAGYDWEDTGKSIQEKGDSGILYIRFCMDLCNRIRNTEMASLRFVVCQKHKHCGLLDGKELSLNKLGLSIKNVQDDMWKMMNENLLFDFSKHLSNNFWKQVECFQDNFIDRSNGFWFGSHAMNRTIVKSWRAKYAQHLIDTGFILEGRTFSPLQSKEYIKYCDALVKKMFWLMQMTGGGPARGTELMMVQVKNSLHCGRHIFIQDGRLFYVLLDHKGRDKRGGVGKPIARFPDKMTSRILLLYLIFVRPIEQILVKKEKEEAKNGSVIDQAEDQNNYKYLFQSRGIKISHRILTLNFENIMKEQHHDIWPISHYRQYYTGVVKHFVKYEGTKSFSVTNELHEQSGHSIGTAHKDYAVSELNMKQLDSVQLESWRRASYKWHSVINVDLAGTNILDSQVNLNKELEGAGEENILNNNTRKEFERLSQELLGRFVSVEKKMDSLQSSVDEVMKLLRTQLRERDDVILCKKRKFDEIDETLPKFSREDIVIALRKAVGNQKASFRNSYQEESVQTVCRGEQDGLFILPTGSGKSILFMILPFLNSNKVSIVIVPLVALQRDLIRKCEEVGISAVKWGERYTAGAQLVFCSCEHVTTEVYKTFVKEYWKTGKLCSIFVDEAHLLKQWNNFRPVMNRICEHIRPEGCQAALNAMSATCPPIMENDLANMAGLRRPKIIRQNGARSNISYKVIKCGDGDIIFELSSMIGDLRKKYNQSRGKERKKENKKVIVYCLTRKECDSITESLAALLPRTMISVNKYHAGMSRRERLEQSETWEGRKFLHTAKGVRIHVMIATSAFGCGIDLPDVEIVIHVRKPRSKMGFLQEGGRAGRNGSYSESIVLHVDTEIAEDYEDIRENISITLNDIDVGGENHKLEIASEEWSEKVHEENTYGSLDQWVNLQIDSCRRWELDEYLDGERPEKKCQERGMELCDLCIKNKLEDNSAEGSTNKELSKNLKRDYKMMSPNDDEAEESIDLDNIGTQKLSWNNAFRNVKSGSRSISEPAGTSDALNNVESSLMSQSQNVSAEKFKEYSLGLEPLCAICSLKQRCPVSHTGGEPDNQSCSQYRVHCLRCGSRFHRSKDCFTNSFRKLKNACYNCSLYYHGKKSLHTSENYGKIICPYRNTIRFMTVAFEDEELRQLLNKKFPHMKRIEKLGDFINWARCEDNEGHTWFADIVEFLKELIF